MPIEVIAHPLAQHLLGHLRDVNTKPEAFRQYSNRLTTILALEGTRDLPTQPITIQTPLGPCPSHCLANSIAVVPILRAGLGMLEPVVSLFPDVSVGYIGLERDEQTAVARSYYKKLPNLNGKVVLLCDPMLATGGSASQATTWLKDLGATEVRMICVVAAPEGVEKLLGDHPDVRVFSSAMDDGLNEKKYIVPGLGDYGDRLYGTL